MVLKQTDPNAFISTSGDITFSGLVSARIFASWDRIVPYGAPFKSDITFKPGHLYEGRLGLSTDAQVYGASFSAVPTRKALQDYGLTIHRLDVVSNNDLVAIFSVQIEARLKIQEALLEVLQLSNVKGPEVSISAPVLAIKVEKIQPIPTVAKPASKRELTDDERDALLMKALETEDEAPSTTRTITEDTGLAVNLSGARAKVRAAQ